MPLASFVPRESAVTNASIRTWLIAGGSAGFRAQAVNSMCGPQLRLLPASMHDGSLALF
jgi:hypothetical protein